MPFYDELVKMILGLLAYAGVSALTVMALAKIFGESWIRSHFESKVEVVRHLNTVEIEKLRIEIQSLLSGKIRLQDWDFTIFPEAWRKLNLSLRALQRASSPMKYLPDLEKMDEYELDEFLEGVDFSAAAKKKIKSSSEKTKTFDNYNTWKKIADVEDAIVEFKTYVDNQSIMMSDQLKAKFEEVAQEMWSALITKRVGHEAKDWKMQTDAWKDLNDKVIPLVNEIRTSVHEKLRAHTER